jgi:hypothetical protein
LSCDLSIDSSFSHTADVCFAKESFYKDIHLCCVPI